MAFTIIMAIAVATLTIFIMWYIVGTLVTPIHSTDNVKLQICVTASGDCPTLEQTITGLMWLVENGTISAADIVIIDDAMDESTRLSAETLARRNDKLHIIEIGEIGEWIRT